MGENAFLHELEVIIRERMQGNEADSYVAKLLKGGSRRVAQKVGEEAVELALAAVAGSRSEQLDEAADLLFHLLVLLNSNGIRLSEISDVLEDRHRRRTTGH